MLDHDPWQAEIGYSLGRAYWGHGYATDALAAILDYGFQLLGLHRIIAISDTRNPASVALLEPLRMWCEGHFIQYAWFKGE